MMGSWLASSTRIKQTRRTLMKRQRTERPLLVIDGDSFAHRANHGLPKSIRRPVTRALALSLASQIT